MSAAICNDSDTDLDPNPREPHDGPVAECFYMVHDPQWRQAGMSTDFGNFPRVGCLEQRLGRELEGDDFKNTCTNRPQRQDSPRLADRKIRKDWSAWGSQGPSAQLGAERAVPERPHPMVRRAKTKGRKKKR